MGLRLLACSLTAAYFIIACQTYTKDKIHVIIDQLENSSMPDSSKLRLLLQADSLATISGNDSMRVSLNIRTGAVYLHMSDAQSAKAHFLEAASIARKINDRKNLAAALNNTGIAYDELFQTDSAIKYYTAATDICRQARDSVRLAQALVNLGILYKNKSEHDKAISITTEAAAILERSSDRRSLSDAYTTLGNSLKALNSLELALSYHKKALRIRQAEKDSVGIAGSLNNIGNIYRYQKKYEQALEQYLSSLAIKEKTGTQKSIANSIDNIAAVYLEQREFSKAKEFFKRALAIRKATGDKDGVLTSINRLCRLFIEMNDLQSAEAMAKEAEVLSQDLNYLKQRIDNTSILTEINLRLGKHKAALEYALRNLKLKDSLFNIGMAQATSEAETRYRTLEKEHELEFVSKLKDQQVIELRIQRSFIVILLILLALLILTAFLLIKAKNKVNVLFKELNHRVENNLQILLSIILLNKHSTRDPAQQAILRTIQERVDAMVSIHHVLKTPAHNKNVQVNMEKFIPDLITNINSSLSKESTCFTTRTNIAPLQFEGKVAVTLGLIINEILTNIYKHGCPLSNDVEINILLKPVNSKFQLSIIDDCAPWQSSGEQQKKGMGLFLIETLSTQLNGKLKTNSTAIGTATTLLF